MNSEGVRATAAHGVAFILNRELVDIADIHMKEIVPGRAAYINMHWHAEKQITILNVYAPNGATDNQDFWKKLKSEYENNRHPKPDIVLGDFNLVEEAVDRLPAREDPDGPVQELKALLQHLDLSAEHAPYLGKGWWTMPLHLLDDHEFMTEIARLGGEAVSEAEKTKRTEDRSENKNPQLIHRDFKKAVAKTARDRLKLKVPKAKRTIKKLTEKNP
ncbi:hypothetical protein FOMPIDRAFT_1030950 [Fomitopsis schrenkii]|uniref:Endonuclease/exonuclease/phosphatase domain-containing protein n=1 Tax=Fomitopsis schrenkii TaxID=2126942 RepID=S8E264_FOMSC|nr:hypothetical protein FOMPIDRAFT_1030950 [Fomitopsis schrenkii]